jgi:hypothetical protein
MNHISGIWEYIYIYEIAFYTLNFTHTPPSLLPQTSIRNTPQLNFNFIGIPMYLLLIQGRKKEKKLGYLNWVERDITTFGLFYLFIDCLFDMNR